MSSLWQQLTQLSKELQNSELKIECWIVLAQWQYEVHNFDGAKNLLEAAMMEAVSSSKPALVDWVIDETEKLPLLSLEHLYSLRPSIQGSEFSFSRDYIYPGEEVDFDLQNLETLNIEERIQILKELIRGQKSINLLLPDLIQVKRIPYQIISNVLQKLAVYLGDDIVFTSFIDDIVRIYCDRREWGRVFALVEFISDQDLKSATIVFNIAANPPTDERPILDLLSQAYGLH